MKKPKKAGTTVVEKVDSKLGIIKVTHHQSIKQSLNYQTAEVGYGVEVHCFEGNVEKTIRRCERIVERAMLPKYKQQAALLNQLTKGRL